MKFGGQSWKTMQKSNAGVSDRLACSCCGRRYKMQWAKTNHERLCKEYWKEEEGGE